LIAGPGRPTTAGSGSWPSKSDDLAAALDGDGVALGVLENTYSPTLVEFYGELGLDFVRLPDTDPTPVRKAPDLGVRSLFLPRVETAAEVREAVRSARFR